MTTTTQSFTFTVSIPLNLLIAVGAATLVTIAVWLMVAGVKRFFTSIDKTEKLESVMIAFCAYPILGFAVGAAHTLNVIMAARFAVFLAAWFIALAAIGAGVYCPVANRREIIGWVSKTWRSSKPKWNLFHTGAHRAVKA